MTRFGGPDPDDDPNIIEGEAREVEENSEPRPRWFDRFRRRTTDGDQPTHNEYEAEEEDEPGPRRISARKLLLLALALVGAILIGFAALNSCGGGDSQSPGDTDSPTAVPSEETTITPEPTQSAVTSTPTPTPTSAIAVPTATVRADTGDPLGVTGGSSGPGGLLMLTAALVTAALCTIVFLRKTGPSA